MFVAIYKIETTQCDSNESIIECGILYVRDYKDAMDQLVNYYGDEDILEIRHLSLHDMSVFTFSEDHFDNINKLIKEAFV